MPKNKSRRGEADRDWETNGTGESFMNESGGDRSSNQVGAGGVGELGDGNDNDHINNNTNGGRPHRNRGGGSSQHRHKQGLGVWTEAVSDAVRSMETTHQAIRDLQDKFASHVDDLKTIEETKDSLMQAQKECREKDDEITRQAATITTLSSMNLKTEEMIEHQKEEIKKERQELEQEKAKQEKRIAAIIAEERHELRQEVDKLVTKHGRSHDTRKRELEDEFAKQRDENDRRVSALEADNKQLSTAVKEQKEANEAQAKKLEKTTEQCDVLERAKDSVKREKQVLEKELEMMKKEFALSPKSKEYLYVF
jgi:chromosome segregation ATPase